jgi:ketopantoate reductase
MNILIYGCGAVGLGIASCLWEGRVNVSLLARLELLTSSLPNGLVRTGIFGNVPW